MLTYNRRTQNYPNYDKALRNVGADIIRPKNVPPLLGLFV